MKAPDWVERYLDGDAAVVRCYACDPKDWLAHARGRTNAPVAPLTSEELDEWRAFLAPHDPPSPVLENLAKLGQSGTLAVVTGQQAGLMGGPMLTLWKAIGAVLRAREASAALGVDVVPVFWVASDDHDYDEVGTHRWLAGDGTLQSHTIPVDPARAGQPVSEMRLTRGDLEAFVQRLGDSLPPSEFRDAMLERLRRLIPEGESSVSWEGHFVAQLLEWLGPLGLVPLAPRLQWVRRRATAVLLREAQEGPEPARELREAGENLERNGAASVIHRVGREANFFLHHAAGRCKLVWEDESVVATPPGSNDVVERLTRAALIEKLQREPEAFSPNAALRPLVQDSILPTIGYVGGPAEVVYHAQLAPLYSRWGIFRPAILPRPSVVLVEPRVTRLLGKLQLNAATVLAEGPEVLTQRVRQIADEDGVARALDAHLKVLRTELDALQALVTASIPDTGTRKATEKLRDSFEHAAAKMMERLGVYLGQRDEDLARAVDRIATALWPDGQPQDRVLGALSPLLRTTGPDGVERIAGMLDADVRAPQCVVLSQLAPAGSTP